MRVALSAFFLIIIGVNFLIWTRAKKNDSTQIMREFLGMIITTSIMALCDIAMLHTSIRDAAYMALFIYYIATCWMVLYIYRFSYYYAFGKRKPFFRAIPFYLNIIGNLLIVVNFMTDAFYGLTHARFAGQWFWVSYQYVPFYIYFAINYAVLLWSGIILVIAITRTAKINHPKYLWVIAVFVFDAFAYAFIETNRYPTFGVISFVLLSCLAIIYITEYMAPKRLVSTALEFVADKLNDGIAFYDENGHLRMATDSLLSAFGLEDREKLKNEHGFWDSRMQESSDKSSMSGVRYEVVRDGLSSFYDIRNRELEEDGFPVGTVYWIQDITESLRNYEEIEHKANFDALTGMYNERHFMEAGNKLVADCPGERFILACTDVAKFRLIGDRFGPEIAEKLIASLADMIGATYTSCEKTEYGRIGVDNFGILMPEKDFDEAVLIKGLDHVRTHFDSDNFSVEIVVGLIRIHDSSLNIETAVNRALMAASTVKGIYGKTIAWYDEELQLNILREAKYNAELTDAIESGQIQMYLQPQVDNDGNAVGSEALVRWVHPSEGVVPPINFIPTFERNGRISEMDRCIWRQACAQLRKWKRMGREDLYISVNISPKDMYAVDIYKEFTGLVQEYGISPRNLKLEITESAIIGDLKQYMLLVSRLQSAGFEVEMDDFGSAYSSFNMLKDICVDVLKIDMKFLDNTENPERSRLILKSIVNLADTLSMRTVAEGVETLEQMEFLKSAGCDTYQGYYFSKPIPVRDFEAKYL